MNDAIASATPPSVPVIMYHSISDGAPPTSISPSLFAAQMDSLQRAGYEVISLKDLLDWRRGEREIAPRTAVITFDDGFDDFRAAAFPILESHGWTATVFLPVGRMGGHEEWEGADVPPRKLMDWAAVGELAESGIDFGGHTVTHANLAAVPLDEARREIEESFAVLADRLGRPPHSFAPPYGSSNSRVRDAIRQHYQISVGVELQNASRDFDCFDVPRIEMHYFRDIRRWDSFLRGGRAYLTTRQLLRRVRKTIGL